MRQVSLDRRNDMLRDGPQLSGFHKVECFLDVRFTDDVMIIPIIHASVSGGGGLSLFVSQ
jgi:hypothetical protein